VQPFRDDGEVPHSATSSPDPTARSPGRPGTRALRLEPAALGLIKNLDRGDYFPQRADRRGRAIRLADVTMNNESSFDYARGLAGDSVRNGDATGWFETLYQEAAQGRAVVPWADRGPNPHLVDWIGGRTGAAAKALIVGCGFGDNAEVVAGSGYEVTAFDISPTVVEAAKARFPGTEVRYTVGDLTAPPEAWRGAFDLVVEIYTLQPLYGETRAAAIEQLPTLVAPGGTLFIVSRATDDPDPQRHPDEMPWPLTQAELEAAGAGLEPVKVEKFLDENPAVLRWRAEFRRPVGE
jgi:SAM-dependent methyltransferase